MYTYIYIYIYIIAAAYECIYYIRVTSALTGLRVPITSVPTPTGPTILPYFCALSNLIFKL